jgi:hypothetical protein
MERKYGFEMFNKEQNVEECDATNDDSSNAVGFKKL